MEGKVPGTLVFAAMRPETVYVLIAATALVLAIVATVKASQGYVFRYPLTLRLVG